jgi:hypothetical protein
MKVIRTEYKGVFFLLPSIAWDRREGVNGVWISFWDFQWYVDFLEQKLRGK